MTPWLWRRHQDAELTEELRSHLALATEDRIARGETPEDAAAAALREFGNPLLVRETVRDTWGWTSLEQWVHDVGYGIRALRSAPAFATAAVLTLALGMGANTAMFSLVRAVVLRPLPFAEPERLVALDEVDLRPGRATRGSLSWPNFHDWRDRSRAIASMAGYHGTNVTVTGAGRPAHARATVVSASLFTTLGVSPARGRVFSAADEQSRADVLVISDEFRRRQLGDAADAVGRGLTVNGRRYTVLGVMPPGFVFPVESPPTEIWMTAAEDARVEAPDDTPMTMQRGAHFVQAIGRLRDGVSIEEARAELDGIASALALEYPSDNANRGAGVTPLLEALVGDVTRPLLLLMAAVGCVLLIACVNLASLLTARGLARRRELALRVALGASRGRVVRLLLAEAGLLAAFGAVVGVGVAQWAIDVLVPLAPGDVRGLDAVRLDPAVLAFTGALAFGCALLIGLLPATRVTRADPRQSLGMTRTAGTGPEERRWLTGLVVAETALGVVLLVAATVAVGGFQRLSRLDPGFDVTNVATLRVDLPDGRYPFARQVTFYDRLLPELWRRPEIESAALVAPLPLSGSRYQISLELPGDTGDERRTRPSPGFAFISPDYFRTMRIPVRRGREFSAADTIDSPRVAVINESFASRYFPGVDPLGQRVKPGLSTTEQETPWREVVGVVADVTQVTLLDEPGPAFYLPHSQAMITTPHLVVRGRQTAETVAAAIRTAIAAADSELAVYDVRPLEDRLVRTMANERFTTLLLTVFAALGLVLAGIGLYGVLAYGVSRRTHEFGVRLALGADASRIARHVLGRAVGVVAAGLLVGIAAAIMAGRVMTSTLRYVEAPGLSTYAVVAALFLLIAVVCGLAPARRAARADPLRELRAI
jgi:putative ABC transport system permease protein